MSSNTTWLSSSATSIFSTASDIFSDQASIATTNSSASRSSVLSHLEAPSKQEALGLRRPLKPPIHDPKRGLWNDTLRVIPCGENHQSTDWQGSFASCSICGFTPWHALMINSRRMTVDEFVAAMSLLDRSSIKMNDYAGNSPMHFLMAAGVKFVYFSHLANRHESTTDQNVFGQNPLHVLNPQDLGDDLVYLLKWFKSRTTPPGLLLTQRDIYARTPLHTLLQHPFPRTHYPRILEVFPFMEHQLLCFNIIGKSVVHMMNMTSLKLRRESESDYLKIQDGISDIEQLLADFVVSGGDGPRYSFSDIARGARGETWFGFFNCRICNHTNKHSNSYLDQMKCACANGRDRNAPDETGLTPAHAIITKERSNQGQDETPAQTAELFRILIPPGDPTLREALHVLDPEGHTLVHNIAVRGLDEILQYVLELETPARRVAMVNACSIGVDGVESSVYECVIQAITELNERIRGNNQFMDEELRKFLLNKATRLKMCIKILAAAGAVTRPSVTKRWRING
ncbi:hypothetical protein BGZ57DRAFT_908551 [Hyaloscypha finlandica]|nr:hypothetical protein BGZ57DRAFT_908551 [Hyaloscypha finlandica]